ncbi:MAG TPA: hypothetical protein VF773_11720 [Verrucomicrobiae bacterium]
MRVAALLNEVEKLWLASPVTASAANNGTLPNAEQAIKAAILDGNPTLGNLYNISLQKRWPDRFDCLRITRYGPFLKGYAAINCNQEKYSPFDAIRVFQHSRAPRFD